MSIASRATVRRLLGVGVATLALSAASATTAFACEGGKGWTHNNGGHHYGHGSGPGSKTPTPSKDACEFSWDGKSWSSAYSFDDTNLTPDANGKISVRVKADNPNDTCTVSLASYLAQGPTFATSGTQVLHDFATVHVSGRQSGTLTVAVPNATCYGQIDLYHGSTEYDGKTGEGHGPAPHGPNGAVIGSALIASWNGPSNGGQDCTQDTSATGGTTGGTTGGDTTGGTTSGSTGGDTSGTTGGDTTGGDTSGSTTSGSTGGDTSGSTGSTTSGSTGGDTTGGTATPTPTPTTSSKSGSTTGGSTSTPTVDATSTGKSGGGLAETGASNVVPIAGGAAVLLLAGGGVVFATRRRAQRH
jgi:LPXTG-motif cell wall-anchored protein